MKKPSLTDLGDKLRNPLFIKGFSLSFKSDNEAAKALGVSIKTLQRMQRDYVVVNARNTISDKTLLKAQKNLIKYGKEHLDIGQRFLKFGQRLSIKEIENLRKTTKTKEGQKGFREAVVKSAKSHKVDYRRLYGYPSETEE